MDFNAKEVETFFKKLTTSSVFKKLLENVIVDIEFIKQKNKKIKRLKSLNENESSDESNISTELKQINLNLEKIINLLSVRNETNKTSE